MRKPAVAGMFYPADKSSLEKLVLECMREAKNSSKTVSAYAGVCPHAGLIYSGIPAACTFMSIKELTKAQTVVIAGPNHTGMGTLVSLSGDDWETPMGIFKNDVEFGNAMLGGATFIKKDEVGHRFEHSIEVQLPFLSIVNPKAKIVPVCMAEQGIEAARDVAQAVLRAEKKLGREAVFIASSDFSHYVSAEWAEKEDHKALSHITKLDAEGFQKERKEKDWSICGFGPISAATLYARGKGSKKGLELMYINSGKASGDYSSVVAYASVAFLR